MTPFDQADIIARVFGYSITELRGSCRDRRLTQVRWIAAATLRDRNLSLPQIGRVLNRHHTSILYGLRELEAA